MTRSIDQDPHSNRSYDDSPTQFINRAQYPEAFTGTPLHQAAGQYFPTYVDHPRFPNIIPPHVVNNPDNAAAREIVPGTDKKPSWMKRGLAALVAVGALGAGAYGISYLKTKGEVDAINDAMGSDRSTSAHANTDEGSYEQYPVKLSAENATGDQFANKDPEYPYAYSRTEQLDYAGPKLNENPQAVAERMRALLNYASNFTEDDGVTTRTVAQPSLTNTPQQILDQNTVGTFYAWETAHAGNTEEAKKIAAVVADPSNREYQDQIDTFSGDSPSIPEGVAWGEKDIIYSGNYEGVQATTDSPVIEFNKTAAKDTNDRVKMVFRFEKGTDPDSARWVLVLTKRM